MVISSRKRNKATKALRGFTIVELLIVIVVIGILAAISIVAYNNVQEKARDSQIRQAVNQIEKAVHLYYLNTGNQPLSGAGSTGPVNNGVCPGATSAGGWAGSGAYQCSLQDILVATNHLPSGYISKLPKSPIYPSFNSGDRTVMFYNCGVNRYSLYWALYSPTDKDTDSINSTLSTCGNSTMIYNNWGMRAGKIIELK